ncbi:DNA gyrase/topoisomerase IV subunit B [Trueperella pyogenes]|uniref:DNA topoisomerase (ATP-hydrolyzing) n=1 Tax=Trueperella pyogenes TaxID=1661 RepID=A0A3Q9GJ11_9ACTO|nr:DNA topoisomerase IV subunit B [Trueperella pyogenes]AWG04736.1 DNA topoisomerase IV subunit B [Trueperella pyogenes]AWG15562.1 DNA topoisomerase IV subunit B [Trueperella pyogenes]AZR04449.1 type IIA DNA topoisomerase subunit B [Trueperella pyogenes]AZR05982.1 type IIA DNA topoisomerase subunit B [Trueperella pyogenes]MCI7689007.1 type IIA DNA topoisomerase subunit B [Trueperella pyogenes]
MSEVHARILHVSTTEKQEYTARHLSVLEGLEAVRKRPGMYIGSTDSRGLMHCLWEIIDNSVDEATEGYASSIRVTLFPDGSVEVEDDGRGIPVDEVPGTGASGVEVVYTKLHAGGKFDSANYGSAGGLHGVGASVVNALSQRLDVAVKREGKIWEMSFRRGEPGVYKDGKAPSPDATFTPFTTQSELRITGKVAKKVTGTRVRYWADPEIFPRDSHFNYDHLIERVREKAFLVPGIEIVVRDERGLPGTPGEAGPVEEVFKYDGGVVDFVDHLATDPAITRTMRLTGQGSFEETVQVLDKKSGHLKARQVERVCDVDIALRWGNGYDTREETFVNIIATPKGGSHLSGFEQGLVKTIRAQIDAKSRQLKVTARDPRIEKDDILAGLTAVIAVRFPEPQFEGQTKEVLGTAPIRNIVAKVVESELTRELTLTKRDAKSENQRVLEKIVAEMRARVAARTQKEISRRKNALETSSLPAKLADCRANDVERTELFIVEGDSALGTAKLARDSEFQALLPIRGKILNVQKASHSDILNNQEVSAIIQVVGAGSGRTFDLDAARYGKIIFMTDADVDGAHIRTLLLTLFFRYMRPLVEAGRVYAAVPPLHRVEVAGRGGKKGEVIYSYSDAELHRILARLEKQGRTYKQPIQRYKGLGEMDADQLAETTMDPQYRMLRRVALTDEDSLRFAEDTFELLMGSEVAPRRDFIVEGAEHISREQIDA